MAFLQISNALVICGGRNDTLCSKNITPMLNDLHLFLLDQKVWLSVKYSFDSERLENVCNSAMTVVCDNYQQERIILFGGVQNAVKTDDEFKNDIDCQSDKELGIGPSKVTSCLTNKTYVV